MNRMPWETLSNAPAYLTNIEPVEAVWPIHGYIYLSYGKAGNRWGLVVGAKGFPSNDVPDHVFEKWAPGIFYWSGD